MKYVIPPNFALLCLFWSVKYAIPASFLLWSVLLLQVLVCEVSFFLQVLVCEVCYSSLFWSMMCFFPARLGLCSVLFLHVVVCEMCYSCTFWSL